MMVSFDSVRDIFLWRAFVIRVISVSFLSSSPFLERFSLTRFMLKRGANGEKFSQ